MCRRGWAAMGLWQLRKKNIIVSDWVCGVNEMPFGPLPVDFNSEWGMDMDRSIPDIRRCHNLLLTAPNMWVKGFLDVKHVCLFTGLRPDVRQNSLGGRG